MRRANLLLASAVTLAANASKAQVTTSHNPKPAAVAAHPWTLSTVDLTKGVTLNSLPPSTVIGSPVQCSSAGTTFLDIYADSNTNVVSTFPQLYSIDRLGTIAHLTRNLPAGFKSYSILSTFATANALISLIEADGRVDRTTSQNTAARQYFLVRSELNGTSPTPIQLDLPLSPVRVAATDSGKFFVLGIDEANLAPKLLLLDSEGSIVKAIAINSQDSAEDLAFQKTLNAKPDPTNTAKRRMATASINYSKFVPSGANVLLVQAASNLPIKILNDDGLQGEMMLKAPPGYLIKQLLVSDPNKPILALLETEAALRSYAERHVETNADELIGVFSRQTMDLFKLMTVNGPQPGEVTCGTDGSLTAIYFPSDEDDVVQKNAKNATVQPERLLFAQAPF